MKSVVKLKEEYIKLGQALKVANLVGSGADAKFLIGDGQVSVNGEVELRRGRKLYDGDVILFNGNDVIIEK
ncbi:MAG: RNA-binding S4 domain-containing protein [Lachnospiraceae bacterium]|nr:RNA-binding S4 domain-containing protein [Lachnospiraceae bacterium]